MDSSASDIGSKETSSYPFVYWAQDDTNIYIQVDVRNVKEPSLEIDDRSILFESHAEGVQGYKLYKFQLELFESIDKGVTKHIYTDRCINFEFVKSKKGWWPRLTSRTTKPHWLKIDFSRWKDPDATESEDEMERKIMQGAMDPSKFDDAELMKSLGLDKDTKSMSIEDAVGKIEDLRNLYLFTYNIALFLGYLFIVLELTHGYMTYGQDYFATAWTNVAPKLKCCVLAQYLEVFHSYLGYTRSSLLPCIVQTSGRAFVLFVILGGEERLQEKPFVFYVFFAWSAIEIFRYPYYALAVKNMSWSLVTWLRYTMWMPLYPAGLLCEATIVVRSIPLFRETGKYSISLPNPLNFSFDFALFETLFLIFGFLPTVVLLIGHMRKQRANKLRQKRVSKMKKAA